MSCAQPSRPALRQRLSLTALALVWLLAGCKQEQVEIWPRPRKVAQEPQTTSITFLTLNVQSDATWARVRAPALLTLLKDAAPDVVALQEVAPWLMKALHEDPWFRRYHQTPVRRANIVPGGLLILSVFPMERTLLARLPGKQERVALLADLHVNGKTLAVVTTHLETPPGAGKLRAAQLDRIFPLLQHTKDAVLIGDLSFADNDKPETRHLPEIYNDAWVALRRNTPGFTWDRDRNAQAHFGAGPHEVNRRAGRLLCRSRVWLPHTIRLVGTRPVTRASPVVFPADNFGVLAVLEYCPEAPAFYY